MAIGREEHRFGDFVLTDEDDTLTLSLGQLVFDVSERELRVLRALARRFPHFVSSQDIIEDAWGLNSEATESDLYTAVKLINGQFGNGFAKNGRKKYRINPDAYAPVESADAGSVPVGLKQRPILTVVPQAIASTEGAKDPKTPLQGAIAAWRERMCVESRAHRRIVADVGLLDINAVSIPPESQFTKDGDANSPTLNDADRKSVV